MSKSKPHNFQNCSIQVAGLPVEAFVQKSDKRKKMHNARCRKAVYVALSSKANRDGSSCYPSADTIARLTGYQKRQVFHYLAQLEKLGFLINEGYAYENGPRKRLLVLPKRAQRLLKPGMRDSNQECRIEKQECRIEVQECRIEKQECALECTLPASSDPPVINPPPVNPELVAEVCSKLGQQTGLDFNQPEVSKTLSELQRRFNKEYALPVVEQFLDREKGLGGFESPKGVLRTLSREANSCFELIKSRIENERLAAAYEAGQAERDAKHQVELATKLALMAEEKASIAGLFG